MTELCQLVLLVVMVDMLMLLLQCWLPIAVLIVVLQYLVSWGLVLVQRLVQVVLLALLMKLMLNMMEMHLVCLRLRLVVECLDQVGLPFRLMVLR